MTLEEVNARIEELEKEVEAMEWLRDLHYLAAEGFLDIDGMHCYPVAEAWCPENL